ncbi:MAG: sulfotransferase domain-containing protein [Chloroflexales bacterium]|nr:sulfotransferase domain-containing protein [Chloroflexales bacterium]
MKSMVKTQLTVQQLKLLPRMLLMQAAGKLGLGQLFLRRMMRSMQSPKQKSEAFAGYQPTQHDVFVCTYAKSGTNWALQIAQQIACYGEAEFDYIHDLIPWPDMRTPVPVIDLRDPRPQQQSPTGLRVIKTHLGSAYVPYNQQAKYVVVIRDPKDVFVSSYYFGKGIINLYGVHFTPEEWLAGFTSNDFFFDSWAAHTASFWPWRERDNVLILTFAEMKQDLPAAIWRIATLMGVRLTDAQLAKVGEKASFQYMKSIDEKFAPPLPTLGGRKARPVMMRSGKSGASGELINAQQQAVIDQFCQAELKRFGSDFPYRRMFGGS